jgi:hypothetical protein
MSDRPEIEIQRQTTFSEDGQLELAETSVETSLEDFGADVDHRDRDSRLDRPEASEFGVDDRPEVEHTSEGTQSSHFADTAEDQQTLAGDDAAARCLFDEEL